MRVGGRWRNSWGVVDGSDFDRIGFQSWTEVLKWGLDAYDLLSVYPSLYIVWGYTPVKDDRSDFGITLVISTSGATPSFPLQS
jgi:hypothetical protein